MSKKSKANLIKEDQDGTFFCIQCGKAGFENKSKAYGHLGVCQGHEAVKKEAKEKIARIDSLESVGHAPSPLSPSYPSKSEERENSVDWKVRCARLEEKNKIYEKIAFNHNQHVAPQMGNVPMQFGSPKDAVASTFGELMQDNSFRLIAKTGAVLLMVKFIIDLYKSVSPKPRKKGH